MCLSDLESNSLPSEFDRDMICDIGLFPKLVCNIVSCFSRTGGSGLGSVVVSYHAVKDKDRAFILIQSSFVFDLIHLVLLSH